MLQHYSPYKVAENFNVLASLAPGRVDLGIGGGPGGLPHTTRALQQETGYGKKPLLDKVVELNQFLHNKLGEDHPLHGLLASPKPLQPADVFVLGTTPSSAEMAADLGLPYIFALFLNNDEDVMRRAVETYRSRFDATNDTQPSAIFALPVIVADSEDEAAHYASEIKLVRIHVESGRTLTVFSVEGAEEFARQSRGKCTFAVQDSSVIHGSQETAAKKLRDIQNLYQVDELFIVTAIDDFRKRLHSYELLSEVFTQAKLS